MNSKKTSVPKRQIHVKFQSQNLCQTHIHTNAWSPSHYEGLPLHLVLQYSLWLELEHVPTACWVPASLPCVEKNHNTWLTLIVFRGKLVNKFQIHVLSLQPTSLLSIVIFPPFNLEPLKQIMYIVSSNLCSLPLSLWYTWTLMTVKKL